MAIATLASVYHNPKVFTGVVKVRKGLAAKLMMSNLSLKTILRYFRKYSRIILKNSDPTQPFYNDIVKNVKETHDKINSLIHS